MASPFDPNQDAMRRLQERRQQQHLGPALVAFFATLVLTLVVAYVAWDMTPDPLSTVVGGVALVLGLAWTVRRTVSAWHGD